MANMCVNTLQFVGDTEQLWLIANMFRSMSEIQGNRGILPQFLEYADNGYFFDILVDDEGFISYTTKWAPNIDIVTLIAQAFGVGYNMSYEELGWNIYGMAVFAVGDEQPAEYNLEDLDFKQYKVTDDGYEYEGAYYESQYDILNQLFYNKFGFEII